MEDGETRRTRTSILLLLVIEREEEKWRREEQRVEVEVERTSLYGGGRVGFVGENWRDAWMAERGGRCGPHASALWECHVNFAFAGPAPSIHQSRRVIHSVTFDLFIII